MRAVVCKEYGPIENLTIETLPDLEPSENEVVIDVKAASINFPETLIVQNLYQFKPELPFTPGSEVSGVVSKIGAKVSTLRVGDRVLANSFIGGLAQQCKVDASSAFKIIDEMSFEEAAAFLYNYATVLHALQQRADLQKGDQLLILGAAGGIGSAAIQIGKAMGASVTAAVSTQEKADFCTQLGADNTVIYPVDGLSKEQQKALTQKFKSITDGSGFDVIVDSVGGNYSEPALRAIAWQGRFLVIGFTTGEIPKIPLNLVLLKGCQIVGVFYGGFIKSHPELNQKNIKQLFALYQDGKIRPPVTKTYPLDDTVQALLDMAQRKIIGKVVVVP